MKNIKICLSSILIIPFCLLLPAKLDAQMKEKAMTTESEIRFTKGKWKDVMARAKKSGQYIFVDAYTSWCAPCKLLKSKTFKEAHAASYYNTNYINYRIDMEKGEGPKLAEKWQVIAYPTLLFFSPEGKLLMRQVGFVTGDKLVDFGKQAKTKS
ncbi:thioredoxin family protein [Olivibacter jilunii]|uniref:thioredoxin family protein n=1 Tax=Olivibacter jilunii TaxID=985016 RepID=UPI003F14D303